MKKLSYIAYALSMALLCGCADYVDTSDYKVEVPESIKTYEYLDNYGTLNSYVDRTTHPNFNLGVNVPIGDFADRSGLFALVCSNFDMITVSDGMLYGNCVNDDGLLNLVNVSKSAAGAEAAGVHVYGHSIMNTTNNNANWMTKMLNNALAQLSDEDKIIDAKLDFAAGDAFNLPLINNFAPTVQDGVLLAKMSNKKHQFYLAYDVPTSLEFNYEILIRLRGNKAANLTLRFGTSENNVKIPVTTDWVDLMIKMPGAADNSFVMIDPGNIKLDLEIESFILRHQRPLNEAEKNELYSGELERWINALMFATKGNVTTWELIDRPLADSGDNGEGYYPLRTAPVGSKTEFYWSDVLGDVNFMKVAQTLANKCASENEIESNFKYFVNEDCLTDVKKAESLLHWIDKWSAEGVKIDGIGTEMHVTCSQNAAALAETQAQIVKNLETLAKSGKEIYVSALDVNFTDADGNAVATVDMTLDQQRAMADFYGWFVKTYFEKVPTNQQAGICQWNACDGATPVGLWSTDLRRIPAFGAFADALQGK